MDHLSVLGAAAAKAGYIAAFTIDRSNVSANDNVMALPRYLVSDHDRGKAFEMLVSGRAAEAATTHARHGYWR